MKVNKIGNGFNPKVVLPQKQIEGQKSAVQNFTKLPLGNIYGTKINKFQPSFKGYWGDFQPAKKLYWIASGKNELGNMKVDSRLIYHGADGAGNKKWINIHPKDAMTMPLEESIDTILALNEAGEKFKEIPDNIKTPNYGDNWGRHANYIEINNRALGKMDGDECSDGILGAIKMLPLIPPSGKSFANCIVLSQLYPNIYGDGWNKPNWEENSLYTIKLDKWNNYGISQNISSPSLKRKDAQMNPMEQVKAFNDLAHLRGIKTGFRMLVSEDQIRIGDGPFNWDNPEHQEEFIEACVNGIDMGFDCIYFDSAKHVGGYDMGNYTGVGKTPSYSQMQYILSEIRHRTGRSDLSFVGERCYGDDSHFQNMGLNAGSGYGNPDNINEIKNNSRAYKNNQVFAPGPDISNDNDEGWDSYEGRLNKIKTGLFGYDNPKDKLPSFMQMHDIFPLKSYTNTHDLMLHNPRFSEAGVPEEHWQNLFEDNEASSKHTKAVFNEFAHALNK